MSQVCFSIERILIWSFCYIGSAGHEAIDSTVTLTSLSGLVLPFKSLFPTCQPFDVLNQEALENLEL